MRSLVSRLARLERIEARTAAYRSITVQYGHLKKLPAEYNGSRHIVTVSRLPNPSTGVDFYQWEERPGPAPVSEPGDERIIRVNYVDAKDGRPC